MVVQDHFTLRLIRLESSEEWLSKPGCLTFLFPRGGLGEYTAGSMTQRLLPGDVFVLGNPTGRLAVSGGETLVFWTFSLQPEHLLSLFTANEICLLQQVLQNLDGTRLISAAGRLARQCHKMIQEMPEQLNIDHRSQLLRIAATILDEEFKTARTRQASCGALEKSVIQIFNGLPSDDLIGLPVGELAGKFNCSQHHLNRLFHQCFGVSVATMRMEMRLLKAVRLLGEMNSKVNYVAEQCGFNHVGLFNTCFKRRFGVSPGQWRKRAAAAGHGRRGLRSHSSSCLLRPEGLCAWNGVSRDGAPSFSRASSLAESAIASMPGALNGNHQFELQAPAQHRKLAGPNA